MRRSKEFALARQTPRPATFRLGQSVSFASLNGFDLRSSLGSVVQPDIERKLNDRNSQMATTDQS
jgi:hypothetical protein